MKSKIVKRALAYMLCMALVLSTGSPMAAAGEEVTSQTDTQTTEKVLICGQEEVAPHQHGDDCYEVDEAGNVKTDESGNPIVICGVEETEGHTHTDACYQEVEIATQAEEPVVEETEAVSETEKTVTEETETTEVVEEEPVAETEAVEDVQEELKSLNYENEEITVTVSEVNAGAIPEGATLKVVPILADDETTAEQYKEVEKQIQSKAEENETEIQGFLAYDITFVDVNGNEVEPNSQVKVTMEYKEPALPKVEKAIETEGTEVSVLHLEEDEEGNVKEVVDMDEVGQLDNIKTTEMKQVEKVEVKTDSFSAYTIVWTYHNRTFNINVTCYDEKGENITPNSKNQITSPSAHSLADLAPEIKGYAVESGEIKIADGDWVEFKRLKIQGYSEGTGDDRQSYYKLRYSTVITGDSWIDTGFEIWSVNDSKTVEVAFSYNKLPTFYYVYVSPNTNGGYSADLLWEGYDFPGIGNDMNLIESTNSGNINELRRRYGFGDGDNSLSKVQNLNDTVQDNKNDKLEQYKSVEYVGARLYTRDSFGSEGNYDFTNIHQNPIYIDYLKKGTFGEFQYKSGSEEYQTVENKDIVFLFADTINREYSLEKAEQDGKVTDFSSNITNNDTPEVTVDKSGYWKDYQNRIAEVVFTINSKQAMKPLDIILVIDSSYSMDFSNYDWNYLECSPDVSEGDYSTSADRFQRFFDSDTAGNRLENGRTRMDEARAAAYSFAKTFLRQANSQNRIAIVDFNSAANVAESEFSNNMQTVIGAIQNINTGADTNTGAGIDAAAGLLKKSVEDDPTKQRAVIVLSDGVPTIAASDNYQTNLTYIINKSDAFSIGVDLSDVGTVDTSYGQKSNGERLSPKEFLATLADEKNAYNAVTGMDPSIAQCFLQIMETLTVSAENAVLHDTVGEYFDKGSVKNVYYSDGSTPDGYTYDKDTGVIQFNIGKLSIVEQKISFEIKLSDGAKDHVDSYFTNGEDVGEVYLTYNVGSEPKTVDNIAKPEVPVLHELIIRYFYMDGGEEKPILVPEGGSNLEKYFIDERIDEQNDEGIQIFPEIDKYEEYIRQSGFPSFVLSDDLKNEGKEYAGAQYTEVRIVTDLESNGKGLYQLVPDNTANVINIIYYDSYMDVDLEKCGTDYGVKLSGAKFNLYQGELVDDSVVWKSEILQEIIVNDNSSVELNQLQSGYYMLEEVEAPIGYQLLGEKVYFKVDAFSDRIILVDKDGDILSDTNGLMWQLNPTNLKQIQIKNKALYALPSSGGFGIFVYMIGGVVLMMTAALILYKRKSREVL